MTLIHHRKILTEESGIIHKFPEDTEKNTELSSEEKERLIKIKKNLQGVK